MFSARIPEWDGNLTAACAYLEIRDEKLTLHVFEEHNTAAAKISLDRADVIHLMNALRKAAKLMGEKTNA